MVANNITQYWNRINKLKENNVSEDITVFNGLVGGSGGGLHIAAFHKRVL